MKAVENIDSSWSKMEKWGEGTQALSNKYKAIYDFKIVVIDADQKLMGEYGVEF